MSQIQASFTKEKDTPNAVRYKQVEEPGGARPSIGTIYVLKKHLTEAFGSIPESIVVTVGVKEDG